LTGLLTGRASGHDFLREAIPPQKQFIRKTARLKCHGPESIDRSLTDLFDGHKDGRMARFYVDGSKIDYDQMFARLDGAIEGLRLYYGLELPTAQSPKRNFPVPCPEETRVDYAPAMRSALSL